MIDSLSLWLRLAVEGQISPLGPCVYLARLRKTTAA